MTRLNFMINDKDHRIEKISVDNVNEHDVFDERFRDKSCKAVVYILK